MDGAAATLDGVTVEKSAGATSNTENGDFYGVNAVLLATDGATVTIKNATVTSSAQNGNGVFSYGSGTTVNISDSVITTTADNSGGIQTTGGGTTNASNLTVETSGNSSAAIRSDRGSGRIINVTSQLGQIGGVNCAHYCAAKAGIIGLTKSLAREVGHTGITVNCIAPGPIETDFFFNGTTEEWRAEKLASLPLGRFGLAREVAPAALLLASDPDGNIFTGQTLGPNSGDVML